MQVSEIGGPILACEPSIAEELKATHPEVAMQQIGTGLCLIPIQYETDAILASVGSKGHAVSPRFLDRFYICTSDNGAHRQRLLEQFFDYLAPIYLELVDSTRNQDNISNLLDIIASFICLLPGSLVIDLGCGVGLSRDVAVRKGVSIIGVDPCPNMRQVSLRRGLSVWGPGELARQPANSIDAAFASYVFHLVPGTGLLSLLWARLKNGAVLAANFHKQQGLQQFEDSMATLGGVALAITDFDDRSPHGAYRAFVKRQ
jgi:hypothetical protein